MYVYKYIHTHKELWEEVSKTHTTPWKQKGWVQASQSQEQVAGNMTLPSRNLCSL